MYYTWNAGASVALRRWCMLYQHRDHAATVQVCEDKCFVITGLACLLKMYVCNYHVRASLAYLKSIVHNLRIPGG